MRKKMTDRADDGIAIVGMACRAPGVHGVEEYWNLLMERVDAISAVPSNRFLTDATTDMRMRKGGFVDNVAGFDADFFSISPREAESMDPQQRLLLECVWEAFEDAGRPRDRWEATNTGVFVGTDTSNYWERRHRSDPNVYGVMGGGERSSIAGRVSYVFDLNGPALSIDSACASSLSAVHLATKSLRDGECDAAIAAGVHLILGPWESRAFSDAGMLSPDHRCKFGDADANGFVRSEGVGVLLLRPLADAIADGDPIHAVIAGSGSSNDGSGSDLFMSPARSGQRLMLERAYTDAGIDPRSVSYVEAHGTGTQAGDPVEIGALQDILGRDRSMANPLHVGSAKTNIGHAEAAAGILGTIKAVLASKHHRVPPNLHFDRPNPEIDWERGALSIPTQAVELGADAIVGVSAFGVSGTNVHLVLTPAPTPTPPRADAARRETGSTHLLTLSASTEEALRDTIRFHLAYFGAGGSGADVDLADICYTAATRRTHHAVRTAVVGETHDEISDALRAILHDPPARAKRTPSRVAFVFPGQGSQWFGMGRELLGTSPAFRSAILECSQAITETAGWSLIDALTDDEQQWDRIDVVQPSLWALQVALARTWQQFGIHPNVVVGHSMGEVAAACISGALTITDGARIMCRRSAAMSTVAGTGAMLVVGAPADAIEQWIDDQGSDVVIAVVNSPTSTVISGPVDHIELAEQNLDAAGYFVRRVAVDVASHSPQMDPLAQLLTADLADLCPRPTEMEFFSTVVSGRLAGPDLVAEYWASNLRNRVRFADTIADIASERPTAFVEISPHPLLSSAIRENNSDSIVVPSTARNQPERYEILRNVASLYSAGVDVDFTGLYESGLCVPMPRYAWQRERFWLDDAFETSPVPVPAPSGQSHPVDLDPTTAPYLDEHVLLGSPMIPGTTMIEHARRVGVSVLGTDAVTVRDAHFFEPLFAADTNVSIVAHMHTPGGVRCELIDDRGTRYFECTIDVATDATDATPVTVLPIHGSSMQSHQLYEVTEAGGLHSGPRMRAVQSVVRTRGALTATVVRPTDLEEDGSLFHPALLEACLTPMLALLERPGWMVAEHIDRIRIHGSDSTMTSHLILRDNGVGGPTQADVVVINGRNEVMAELTGVTVRTSAPIAAQWLPHSAVDSVPAPTETRTSTARDGSASAAIVITGDLDIIEPTSGLQIRLSGRIEVTPGSVPSGRSAQSAFEALTPAPTPHPVRAHVTTVRPKPTTVTPEPPVAAEPTATEPVATEAIATEVDVLDLLMTTVAGTLRKPKARLSPDARARDIGLDSIMSLEVKTRLQSDLTVDIPAKLLLQASSLREAADTISSLRKDSRGLRQ